MSNVFAVPVFFIVFRETVETSIVVAVLLSFIERTLGNAAQRTIQKKLVRQVWFGTLAGILVCFIAGAGLITAFYKLGTNVWEKAEILYEGLFGLAAAIIITVIGATMLRISKMQEKWITKLTAALDNTSSQTTTTTSLKSRMSIWAQKYAMFLLPFVTVLREGLEATLFVSGVSFAAPASAFPLPIILGLLGGSVIGWLIYKGGNTVRLQWFLVASTCVLYLVAAGLLSRAAWSIDTYQWSKMVSGELDEMGSGPGSYNIHRAVWHVNCCSPSEHGGSGWGVFKAILGWQNTATYSSVIVYNVYWICTSLWFLLMLFQEKKGRYPFMKAKIPSVAGGGGSEQSDSRGSVENAGVMTGKEQETEVVVTVG